MNMRSLISVVLSAALIVTATPLRAEMAGTGQILTQETRAAHLAQVQTFLARDEVRSQMEAMGVNTAQATERVAAMTNGELQQMAQHIQDAPAGADGVLGAILLILVILVILELLGAINIFAKI
ncbi:MAG: PA2779 family protein [Pseudomonadota bacterium]